MQYLGHKYTKNLAIYLIFKFNWMFCILPGNPTHAQRFSFFTFQFSCDQVPEETVDEP